jgi:hypothetical protein
LARDRFTRLITQAHTAGYIDCAKFDPFDTWHLKSLQLVLQRLEDERQQKIQDTNFRYYTAMAGSPWLASADDCFEKANAARLAFIESLSPHSTKPDTAKAVDGIAETYKAIIGSPGEPYYEAMIAELLNPAKKAKISDAERETRRIQREAAARRAAMGMEEG